MQAVSQIDVGLDTVRGALDRVDFLSHITGRKRDQYLTRLIRQSYLRNYEDGQRIIAQGEHGHTMFVLVKGRVRVELENGAERVAVAELETDQSQTVWFGEGVILGRTPRSASVVSAGSAVLLEIEKVRLEKLDGLATGVIDKIERIADQRVIESFLQGHRAFSALPKAAIDTLCEHARVHGADRGAILFRRAEPAGSVLIVTSGVTRLSRAGEGTVAYFSAGDVVGHGPSHTRPGDLSAAAAVEYLEIPKTVFDKVAAEADQSIEVIGAGGSRGAWSDQLRKDESKAPAVRIGDGSAGSTNMIFLEEFVKEGAQAAQSLLTIDLDLCIRCGACVRGCESRHGHAKLTRRGKRLVRRRRQDQPGVHQPLLLPSSCRHCESPECMIGCPTGAIHRKPTGEVAIHDFCIGCSNCALRCPWDNISMVETPGRWVLDQVTGGKVASPKIANKCDLCAGYDEANCVAACPTQAILRVEPSYFPEVRAALGVRGGGEEGRTTAAETKDRSTAYVLGGALLLLAALLAGWTRSAGAASTWGMGLGAAAALLMLASTALAGRRRLSGRPGKPPHPDEPANPKRAYWSQLGPFWLWTKIHLAVGALSTAAVVLHADFGAGSALTGLLLALSVLQLLLGGAGVLLYRWLPKAITRIEGDAQLEEEARDERRGLRERQRDQGPEIEPVLAAARGVIGRWPRRLSAGYQPEQTRVAALEGCAEALDALPRELRLTAQAAVEDLVRVRELQALDVLYRLRPAFVATHAGVAIMLLLLAAAHVTSVLAFYPLRWLP